MIVPTDLVTAVAQYGFTTRQAAFLATVLRHAGVCIQRQYAAFAGLANGQTVREFFDRLTSERFATAYRCWQRGGRLYHLHHKGLYTAIGDPDNRHRRRTIVTRATERLMVLDAVLTHPELEWLATEREKTAYFIHQRGLTPAELPTLMFDGRGVRTTRHFPAKLPIGIGANSTDIVFLYPIVEPGGHALRAFLREHHALVRRVPRWTLQLVAPSNLAAAGKAHVAVAEAFLAAPLRPSVIEEFQWFCRARQATEQQHGAAVPSGDLQRYAVARRAFGAPRFYEVYRAWLKQGDSACAELQSSRLHDAWQRGDVRVELEVLPYCYEHLAPATTTT